MENKVEKYYGQYGQDSIMKQFFDRKNINKGVFVDIGASEGKRLSNTLLLEENGWTGICVEAHPSYFDVLKANRPNSICYSAAAGDRDKIKTPITDIQDLEADTPGEFVVFGKMMEKNLRDLNEAVNLVKRGGRRAETHNLWLNMKFEDDTGPILAGIDRWKYPKLGKPIVEKGRIGDWYLLKGRINKGFRKLQIDKWRKLT